jgi:hypothetical protein
LQPPAGVSLRNARPWGAFRQQAWFAQSEENPGSFSMTNSISRVGPDAARAPVTVVACAAPGAQAPAAIPRARPWLGMMLTVHACAFLTAGLVAAAAQTSGIEEEVSERGVAPKLALTPAQRSAIYQEVHKERSKVAPSRFAAHVGAEVPPMIELYTLPDDILANSPETKLYKFTKVDDQVVLVDPTKMRVIAVIGPKTKD